MIVIVVVYYLLRTYLENEQKKQLMELKSAAQKLITPVRLQSYERMVLFLERISPQNLILRVSKQGMKPLEMQTAMIQTIREEFDHNITQQLYITGTGWEMIRNAREEMIRTINTAAASLGENDDTTRFAGIIMEQWSARKKNPIQQAIDFLKEEISRYF